MPAEEYPLPPPGRRILVAGVTGVGKTTLAAALARRLRIPHIELDALNWGPQWTPAPVDRFRAGVAAAVQQEGWVVDGNYSSVRDLVLARADTVVWLDYRFAVIFWQLLRRTIRRSLSGEELWAGNRESLRISFCSRDSLLLWAIRIYYRRRRQYTALMADPAYAHIRFIHLRSPRALRGWLAGFAGDDSRRHPPQSD